MLQYIFMKWVSCFLVGIVVGLIAFCNNLAVENIAGIKFVVTSNMMLQRRLLHFHFRIEFWLLFVDFLSSILLFVVGDFTGFGWLLPSSSSQIWV